MNRPTRMVTSTLRSILNHTDMIRPKTHLGNLVYASFDGQYISLTVNDQRDPPVVHLDQGVMRNLIQFNDEVNKSIDDEQTFKEDKE